MGFVGPSFPTQFFKQRYVQDIGRTALDTVVGCSSQSVDAVWGNYQCSVICAKQINTLCEQNLEFFNVKPDGTCSKHWALNVVCKSNGILHRKFKVLQFMQ